MPASERRQTPRTTMERLACLQIEPDNGAIVLNVSDNGLCFHSIAPVEQNGPVRFSFLEQNRRIDASGELAWTDDMQKIAGMRFTTLTGEAREQIANLVKQPSAQHGNGKANGTSTLGAALLRAFPDITRIRPRTSRTSRKIADFLRAGLTQVKVRIRLTGYSKGLLTGLLVSFVWISALFIYEHRRQVGESLISLGQRLAAKPEIASQTAQAAPQLIASAPSALAPLASSAQVVTPEHAQAPYRDQNQPKQTQPKPTQQSAGTPILPSKPKDIPPGPAKQIQSGSTQARSNQSTVGESKLAQSKPGERQPDPPQSVAATSHRVDTSTAPHVPTATSNAAAELHPSTMNVPPPTVAALAANKSAPPVFETVSARPTPALAQPDATPQMYFDVGRFKDQIKARSLSDNLAQLGLRVNVVQKGHLWMNAFDVLVGPYGTDDEATRAHKNLLSHGYNPRPFERGTRNFLFSSGVTLNGTKFPVGDFKINWESYFADARVQFIQGDSVVTSARGKWVKRPSRYSVNEFVYLRSPDGSKTLVEIHFSGLDQALVFGGAS
jgi:hypothetical protein